MKLGQLTIRTMDTTWDVYVEREKPRGSLGLNLRYLDPVGSFNTLDEAMELANMHLAVGENVTIEEDHELRHIYHE